MAAPKCKTPAQQLALKQQIASLRARGKTQTDIAGEIGISQGMVSNYWQQIEAEWKSAILASTDEIKARQVAELDEVKAAAWQGWTRSLEDAQVVMTEEFSIKMAEKKRGAVRDAKIPAEKKRTQTKGQAGDPRFLEKIINCVDKQAELIGTKAPIKTENIHGLPEDDGSDILAKLEKLAAGNGGSGKGRVPGSASTG